MATTTANAQALALRKFARQHGIDITYTDCLKIWVKVRDMELCKEIILIKPSWAWW